MIYSYRICLLLLVVGSHLFFGMEKTLAEKIVRPGKPAELFEDVTLDPSGNFFCCLRNEQKNYKTMVRLYQAGKLIACIETNSQQAFGFSGLRPGTYQVDWDCPDDSYHTKMVRIWKHDQAPPVAKDYLSLQTVAPPVVRGQYGSGDSNGGSTSPVGMRRIFRNPWISAAIISTAIAVPIAVAYDDDDAS
ncbi:MAG: hypothetical protein N2B57_07960 [Planctomycetales bacterium]